jgi:hypothetical protein
MCSVGLKDIPESPEEEAAQGSKVLHMNSRKQVTNLSSRSPAAGEGPAVMSPSGGLEGKRLSYTRK